MLGYKLFRKRKNGTYGPLFINRSQSLELGVTYVSEAHRTNGYAFRPGWHICSEPIAPHLSTKGRVWCVVEFDEMAKLLRPESQGGVWYLGGKMTILKELNNDTT